MTLRQALLSGKRRPRRHAEGSPLMYRGDGYEFVELREYVNGDDVRRIDWAASARTAQLQTRVMLEDVALTLGVYVDDSPSMQAGRHRALLDAAAEIRDEWLAAGLRSDRRTELASLAEARALPRGAALLVASDFFTLPDDDELAYYAYRFDCTAMIASDPWQEELPFDGFIHVRDAETDQMQLLFVGERERRRYREASLEREAALIARFEGYGWRTATFGEDDGRESLLRAFGLA